LHELEKSKGGKSFPAGKNNLQLRLTII